MAKITNSGVNFVRSIFSRDRQKSELAVSSRELIAGSRGGAFASPIGVSGVGGVGEALGLDRRMLHRFRDYEEMDEYGDISCLSGDSMIFTLDKGWMKISSLATDSGSFFVLSYDKKRKSLVPAFCEGARRTGVSGHRKKMVRLILDDGSSIRCTEDHLFMTKDEEWIEAGSLTTGTRLMPGVVRIDLSREKIESVVMKSETIADVARKIGISWRTMKRNVEHYDLRNEFVSHRVLRVEILDETEDVYDLSVPKYHNFVCNGVVVHNSALDIYADDATQVDGQSGRTVWVESQDRRVKEELEDMFWKRLNIEENVWPIARTLCKYGNNFEEIVVSDKGVVDLRFMPPATAKRVESNKGDLLGFAQSYSQDITISEREFEKMRLATGAAIGPEKDVAVYEDWRVSHMRLLSKHRDSLYGWSITEPARWVWKRLMLLEDAVLVYKLCLRGDSQVWTSDGRKSIRDIEEGDEVYSYTKNDTLKKTKVVYKKHNGVDTLYRIKSVHRELYANATHPVLVETIIGNGSGKPKCRSVDYVEAQDLIPGVHRLVTPHRDDSLCDKISIMLPEVGQKARLSKKALDDGVKIEVGVKRLQDSCGMQAHRVKAFFDGEYEVVAHTAQRVLVENGTPLHYLKVRDDWGGVKELNIPEFVTPDFARWFGFMIGDGFVSERPFDRNGRKYLVRTVGFSAGDKEDVNQRYKSIFESFFGETKFTNDKRSKYDGVGYYSINSKALHEFMILNGFIPGANNKRIPEWVFRSSTSIRSAFLEGLADADGHINEGGVSEKRGRVKHKRVTLEMCNKELVEDVRELVMQVGFKVGSVTSRVRIGGREILNNGHVLGDRVSYSVSWSYDRQPMTEVLKSVEEVEVDDIWDIGVEADEHNFVANGIVVHNTRSPSRYAFYIDVGKLPRQEAERSIRDVMQKLKKKKFVDPKCLTGDTCVKLLDGTDRSMAELSRDCANEKFWVYSYDLESGKVVPGLASNPRLTDKRQKIYRVVLDSGAVVRCNAVHPFLLRDGTYRAASELLAGDSLMPLYVGGGQESTKGYSTFRDPSTGKTQYVHRAVVEGMVGDVPDGMHVHHKNGVKADNRPENLELLSPSDHLKEHPENLVQARDAFARRVGSDPGFRDEIIGRLDRWRQREPGRVREIYQSCARERMRDRKEKAAPGQAVLLSVIEAEVVRDPLVVGEELVERLNANPVFADVYASLSTTQSVTISVGTLQAFLRRQGYRGIKAFKMDKTGQARWRNRTYGGKNIVEGNNHKVVSVSIDGCEDVYNLDVEKYHNFLLTAGVFTHNTGKLDLKFNPLAMDEDFFLGVRDGKESTRVETLMGPSYQQVDDVQYFLYKLYAALKVPRAYMGYDENQPSKATLSQEDVRFARTIMRVQREIRNGLKKVARVDLACRNIDPAAVDFDVKMTVPSSIFELGQMEVRRARADLASLMERHVSMRWMLSNVYGLSDDEIEEVAKEKKDEQKMAGGQPGFESNDPDKDRRTISERLRKATGGISERELSDGNREDEKRVEEVVRRVMADPLNPMGKSLRETGSLIREILHTVRKAS